MQENKAGAWQGQKKFFVMSSRKKTKHGQDAKKKVQDWSRV
jgi:hypothetical protein